MSVVLSWLGSAPLATARTLAANLRLLHHAFLRLWEVEGRRVLQQAYAVANRSLLFVAVTMAFSGAIMLVQAATQAERLLGDLSSVGPAFLQLLVREFGPTVVALMIAARYGAAVAAEIGAMAISEQLDALTMSGVEPVPYLVTPRILGGLLGMAPVAVFGTAIAFVAGGLAARYGFAVGWESFFSTRLLHLEDVLVGVSKATAYGVAVPLAASQAGLAARGGAPGVGRATTRAVIDASLAVLALDLAVGSFAYVAGGHLG